MRFNGVFRAGVLAALAGVAFTAETRAADMPLYESPGIVYAPEEPMELGSGWYLRGDAAYSDEDSPAFNATSHSFGRNVTTSGYAVGLGVGYKLTSFFRVDLTGDFLDPFNFANQASCGATCSTVTKNDVWRWDALANGYFDLGTWYRVTPYIGGGVGVAGTRQDIKQRTVSSGFASAATTSSEDSYELAWAAMAGISYAFAPHAMLDIGYRYIDLGRSSVTLAQQSAPKKDLTAHQVRIGLRYMID